ncbi:MAG TPA: type IV pilus secretin PilQ [Polyangiaceae bacterium]|nr:type IV pilus secretin PilQ [Polyangiaceae bacterium]
MRWTPPRQTQNDPRRNHPRGARSSRFFLAGLASLAVLSAAFGAEAATSGRHATKVELRPLEAARSAEVVVQFTDVPTYTARLDSGNRRLVVDVIDADVMGAKSALTDRVGVVGGVLTQAFSSNGAKTTRVLVTLLEDARYSVSVRDKSLVVSLRPGEPGIDDLAAPEKKVAKPADDGTPRVSDVKFEHHDDRDDVVVELAGSPKILDVKSEDDRFRLVLENTDLPAALERKLDVAAFAGLLGSVSTFADPAKHTVTLEAEAAAKVESRVLRHGRTLTWTFFKPGSLPTTMTGVAQDGGVARKARTLHVDDSIKDIPAVTTNFHGAGAKRGVVETRSGEDQAAAFTPAIAGQADAAGAAGKYDGRRIDLDLKDADIHNVLRLLADVGHVNIVTADDVQGTVTIRMRNIPWDQALDVVLQSKNLGMVQRGNIIRVAPLAQLEKEREMAIARRRQELQLAPLETRLVPVSYAQASEIQARARDLLSSRGSIAVDGRTNVLIVRDVAGNLDQIEELTRSLDTQTPQVLVEARVVEATSRYLRDFGIQWGGDATFSASTGNPTGLAFPNSVGLAGGASDATTPTAGLSPFQRQINNPNFAVNLPAAVGTGSGGAIGITLGSIDNNFNLNLRLSAAESNGLLRILSSPRILTLDNHEARIAQGTLIPFSQVSAQGVQTTFQEAKLQLLVKPHVTADGSISMHVKINRDEPDFNQTSARGDPTILKREAETDLLVMDGHTAVIGGIYTRNTGRNVDQVPFFGDIPLIGLLFQHRRASDTRGELVIFLTPRIVNRAEALGR